MDCAGVRAALFLLPETRGRRILDQLILRYAAAGVVVTLFSMVALRSAMLRRAGVPVFMAGARGNSIQRWLIAGAGAYVPYLVLRAPFPSLDAALLAGPSPVPALALILMIAGFLVIVAAQFGMGRSWRVGVPSGKGDVAALVTSGVYRFSRNPIYLGIMILLIGAAAAAPGPFAFGAAVACFIAFTAIIRAEESYLQERFGAAYEEYCRRVRRWI